VDVLVEVEEASTHPRECRIRAVLFDDWSQIFDLLVEHFKILLVWGYRLEKSWCEFIWGYRKDCVAHLNHVNQCNQATHGRLEWRKCVRAFLEKNQSCFCSFPWKSKSSPSLAGMGVQMISLIACVCGQSRNARWRSYYMCNSGKSGRNRGRRFWAESWHSRGWWICRKDCCSAWANLGPPSIPPHSWKYRTEYSEEAILDDVWKYRNTVSISILFFRDALKKNWHWVWRRLSPLGRCILVWLKADSIKLRPALNLTAVVLIQALD